MDHLTHKLYQFMGLWQMHALRSYLFPNKCNSIQSDKRCPFFYIIKECIKHIKQNPMVLIVKVNLILAKGRPYIMDFSLIINELTSPVFSGRFVVFYFLFYIFVFDKCDG